MSLADLSSPRRARMPLERAVLLLVAVLTLCLSLAHAQTPAAQKAADGVMEGWLRGELVPDPRGVSSVRQLERSLIDQLRFSPPPREARTNYALRKFIEVNPQTRAETYRYPVASSAPDLEVDVTVRPSVDDPPQWEAYTVRPASSGQRLPPALYHPLTPWLFGLFTVLMLLALRRGPLRSGLEVALRIAREERRVFLGVNIALYGIFVLGSLLAFAIPGIAREVTDLLSSGLDSTGIVELASRGVPEAASGIAYWNFTQGAVSTTFLPGLLLGIPALLINFFRFLVLGFALSPALLPGVAYVLHLPTIVLELQAYVFVTASSVALFWRGRKLGWGVAFRDYFASLWVALVLLVLAAWYEAFELLVLLPRLTGSA